MSLIMILLLPTLPYSGQIRETAKIKKHQANTLFQKQNLAQEGSRSRREVAKKIHTRTHTQSPKNIHQFRGAGSLIPCCSPRRSQKED